MKTFKKFINEVKKPTGQLKNACWSGYTAVGMKMKGGRKVPNCVPEEVEIQEEFKKGDRVRHNDGTLGTVTREPDDQGLVQWKHAGNKHRVSSKNVLKSAADEKFRWRQQKEEVEQKDFSKEASEEIFKSIDEQEQLDEISKQTLTSYRQKAKAKADTMAKAHTDVVKKDMATGDFTKSKASHAKIAKLDRGVLKAGQKLQKKHAADIEKATQGPKKPVKPETPEQKWKRENPNSNRSYWGEETEQLDEKSAAWQRKEGKNPSGGLNKKGVMSYRREHPGSTLKTAVTTKPSKLKPGSKAANRRKSFCARMSGMKKRLTSAKTARDPNSRINKSLRKWNC